MLKPWVLTVSVGFAAAIAVAQTPLSFTPLQPDLFAAGASFVNAFADIEGDGDLDLFVGFDGQPNRLYRNDAGVFTDVAAASGVADRRATRAAAWGDMDADGDPDLLVGFTPSPGGSVLRLYRNDGGVFTDADVHRRAHVGLPAPSVSRCGSTWTATATWISSSPSAIAPTRSSGTTAASSPTWRRRSGWPTRARASAPCGSTPTRTVTSTWPWPTWTATPTACSSTTAAGSPMWRKQAGVAWGGRPPRHPGRGTVRLCAADLDSDGHFDLIAANYGPLGFFSNRGRGQFDDRAAQWGLAIDSRYDACAPADIDHDGRMDLYVNGTVTGGVSWQDSLLHNTGTSFVDVTPPVIRRLQADHGVQWADVDGDGDLDLALTGARAGGMHFVLHNDLPAADAARGLHVRAVDAAGHATLAGAEVRVFAAGTTRLVGARLVDAGSGYDAQNDMPVHVGIPAGTSRVDVQLIVPRGGRRLPVWTRNVDAAAWHGRALVFRAQK